MASDIDTLWLRLYGALSALGWKDHEEGGFYGLLSPNDSIFIGPEELSEARRQTFIEALNRHVGSMEETATGVEALRGALADFKQLQQQLDSLIN